MSQMGTGSVTDQLTEKQAEVLSYIEREITRNGCPPTYRDIASHCGYEAVGTAQDHVRALIKKGFLHKEPGVARGIRLAHAARNVLAKGQEHGRALIADALKHFDSLQVPILGTVPAGRPNEAIESGLGYISIPAKWRGELYALRVSGESMIEAGIFDGDFVVVHKQSAARSGDIVVAMINGEATVKYLEKKGQRVRLLPANPRFSPIDVPVESDNLIQGKVVSVQRYYG